MYMTSALSKNDMKAIGLQMALDLLAKKEKRDSITGLRTRTQPGRPEWGKVRTISFSVVLFMSAVQHVVTFRGSLFDFYLNFFLLFLSLVYYFIF